MGKGTTVMLLPVNGNLIHDPTKLLIQSAFLTTIPVPVTADISDTSFLNLTLT